MWNHRIIFFLSMMVFGLTTIAQPILEYGELRYDFGTIKEGDLATHNFVIRNTGDQPLIISKVKASCGCTTPNWTKEPIMPGEKGVVTAVYNSKNRQGHFNKSIAITSNATETVTTLYIKGRVALPEGHPKLPSNEQFALSARIEIKKLTYDLGDVAFNQVTALPIHIKNVGLSKLAVVNVTASCRCIKVDPSTTRVYEKGKSGLTNLLFTPRKTGKFEEKIIIHTNDLYKPKVQITLKATIVEKIGGGSLVEKEKPIKF